MTTTEQIKDIHLCKKCNKLLCDPVTVNKCGHTFCGPCIVYDDSYRCPLCPTHINRNNVNSELSLNAPLEEHLKQKYKNLYDERLVECRDKQMKQMIPVLQNRFEKHINGAEEEINTVRAGYARLDNELDALKQSRPSFFYQYLSIVMCIGSALLFIGVMMLCLSAMEEIEYPKYDELVAANGNSIDSNKKLVDAIQSDVHKITFALSRISVSLIGVCTFGIGVSILYCILNSLLVAKIDRLSAPVTITYPRWWSPARTPVTNQVTNSVTQNNNLGDNLVS